MHAAAPMNAWQGTVQAGAGGATPAFLYRSGRRMREIEAILGFLPYPGSLNVRLSKPFDWSLPHVEGQVLDVVERGKGLDVPWRPRTARFYPVMVNDLEAWAFRFDGERYRPDFVELIAPVRLRDHLDSDRVVICSR